MITSRNSLSGTIRLMTEFPDQRRMVLDDPSLIPQMSEEALRMVSPVMHMRRTATEDTELNSQRIAKDEKSGAVVWRRQPRPGHLSRPGQLQPASRQCG